MIVLCSIFAALSNSPFSLQCANKGEFYRVFCWMMSKKIHYTAGLRQYNLEINKWNKNHSNGSR